VRGWRVNPLPPHHHIPPELDECSLPPPPNSSDITTLEMMTLLTALAKTILKVGMVLRNGTTLNRMRSPVTFLHPHQNMPKATRVLRVLRVLKAVRV
jgi:hypothetical protein